MSLAIVPIGQLFGKYEHQARLAELNMKMPVKKIQNQVDRVTISPEARKAQVLGIARAVREASKDLSTESKPADSESLSHADRIIQSSKGKKIENHNNQAAAVKEKVIRKAIELAERSQAEAIAKKNEQDEKEATPF